MMHSIEQFGMELYANSNNISKKPPLTYEAYNFAVQQHLHDLKHDILGIEKALVKQGTYVYTRVCVCVHARVNVCVRHQNVLYFRQYQHVFIDLRFVAKTFEHCANFI